MSRAKQLLQLQEVDLRRDSALARLKEVVALLRGNAAVSDAERSVGEAEERLSAIERRLRSHDLERQGVKEHVAREEGKLYGGRVKSPKELESLEMEVASLKRRLSQLDDTALELMLERDEANAALERAREELETVAASTASATAALTDEKANLAREVRQLDARRGELAEPITPQERALYDRVRKAKGGRAVAELHGEHCGVCGMKLPRHDLDDARSGTRLVQCPGCSRVVCG